jgi:hypothetical protein
MASGASVAVTVAVLMAVAIMEVLGAIINAGGSSEWHWQEGGSLEQLVSTWERYKKAIKREIIS